MTADREQPEPTSTGEHEPVREETTLRVGTRLIGSRYFLAPLAGYTQLPFRLALRSLGGLGLATTDLVQATLLRSRHRRALELVATSPEDQPLSVQLHGSQPAELIRAAQWLEQHGYGGVDINMGCPVAGKTGQGGGARLACDVEAACRLVQSVVESVALPVTVKLRLGWDDESITAPRLAREFEKIGVGAITIHGRTRQQGFSGRVCLDGIRQTVEAVERIPVIGNGDVLTVEDALNMRRATGCDAVAIGRGAMLDPWIFRKLDQTARGEPVCELTPDEQITFLERHFELTLRQHAEHGCRLIRKYVGWYGARLGIPEDLEDRLRRMDAPAQFERLVEEIRRRHGERREPVATALIRVPDGPVEHW
ncbi:MAG: hypothetical protein CMJ48_01820 [Planctomycetaceae bacterium]|nr:hypothetical protein [Planctomycetaceae bacterium]